MASQLDIGRFLLSLEAIVDTKYITLISAEGNHICGRSPIDHKRTAYASMIGIFATAAENSIHKGLADATINYKDGSTLYVCGVGPANLLAIFFDKDKNKVDVNAAIEKLKSENISGKLYDLLSL